MEEKNKILTILDTHKIPYIISGKNVGKKAIAGVNCPFCGNDTGYHVGILKYKNHYYYKCWKNSTHKGSLIKLFSVLLSKTIDECKFLLTLDENYDIINTEQEKEQRKLGGVYDLKYNDEFKPILNEGIYKQFYNYLYKRGFTNTKEFISRYKLQCTITGEWAYRIIIPIYYQYKLVSWSGRSITDNPLRYKDLAIDKSVRHVKYNLFDFDYINKEITEKLYICEGQFDAMKLGMYSKNNATCLFTVTIQPEQVALLYNLAQKYKELILIFDQNAEIQLFNIMKQLSFIRNLKFQYLPKGIKDPGMLTQEQILELGY
jgi:hypothetical protein